MTSQYKGHDGDQTEQAYVQVFKMLMLMIYFTTLKKTIREQKIFEHV